MSMFSPLNKDIKNHVNWYVYNSICRKIEEEKYRKDEPANQDSPKVSVQSLECFSKVNVRSLDQDLKHYTKESLSNITMYSN